MKLFVTIYNDAMLLGHFLRHYHRAGITNFYIATKPEFRAAVESFSDRYCIDIADHMIVEDTILGAFSAIAEMRHLYQHEDEWVVIVDLDEFIEFPDPIDAITSRADYVGANVVRGVMLDRFAANGRLAEIAADSDLNQLLPIKSRFIRNVMHGSDHKGVLVKGALDGMAGSGHHRFEGEIVFSELLQISHYKWITGALDRLRATHKVTVQAGSDWAKEYQRVFDHYDVHGRFAWEEFGGQPAADFKMDRTINCGECRAALSESEYEYSISHFGLALCRSDQNKRRAHAHRDATDG
jgi:uncharacterized CHY-type Zn-finger protein